MSQFPSFERKLNFHKIIFITFDLKICLCDDSVDIAGVLAHVGKGRIGDDQLVDEALILNGHLVLLPLENFL